MEPKLISRQQLIAAVKAINAAGCGEVAESIYRNVIMPDTGKTAERNISVARLVYALSPGRYRDEWYTVSLFRGVSSYLQPSRQKEAYAVSLLEEAGFARTHAYALTELASADCDIEDYSPLALTLKFADLNTDKNGRYIHAGKSHTGPDDVMLDISGDVIKTQFTLKQRNMLKKYEDILAKEVRKGEEDVSSR